MIPPGGPELLHSGGRHWAHFCSLVPCPVDSPSQQASGEGCPLFSTSRGSTEPSRQGACHSNWVWRHLSLLTHTFETLPLYQQWQAGPSFHRAAVVEQTIPHTSSWKGITEGSEHVMCASLRPGAGLRLFTDVTVSVTLELTRAAISLILQTRTLRCEECK